MDPSQTALITGSTSGIGLELARVFARDHVNLVCVAHEEEKLRAQATDFEHEYGIRVVTITKDLSRQESAREVFDELHKQSMFITTLVNNAGFGTSGLFRDIPADKELSEMNLNMITLTLLTKFFLQQSGLTRGTILNVASTAAFQPGPTMAVYYATKAYVLFLSEAIAEECEGTGITVTALCPGPTRTGFSKEANVDQTKLFTSRHVMDARVVAEAAYRGMQKGKRIVIPGLRNRMFALGPRFAPRRLVTKITKRFQR